MRGVWFGAWGEAGMSNREESHWQATGELSGAKE